MPLAVLADVHANLPALRAALDDVEALGIEDVVVLGDVVGFGPSPAETIDLLRRRAVPVLRGNHEEALLGRSPPGAPPAVLAAAEWTRARLPERDRAWIEALPQERRLVVDGKGHLLAHASPGSAWTGIDLEKATDDDLRDTLRAAHAEVLLVGHTHRIGIRPLGKGRLVANPGSVGLSFDGPEATYLVLDRDSVAERRVAYDVGDLFDRLRKEGVPAASLPQPARRFLPGG